MRFLKLIVTLAFIFSSSLSGQFLRTPGEVIDIQRVLRLQELWENQVFPSEEILRLLQIEIQNYYDQFRKERYIRDTEISVPYDFFRFPLDKVHVLIYVRSLEDIQKANRIFSPYLHQVFLLQGRIYEKMNRPTNAIASYLQSLYYGIPVIDVKQKNNLPDSMEIHSLDAFLSDPEFLEKLSSFSFWEVTFGDANYRKEILDKNFHDTVERFLTILQSFRGSLEDIKTIKKNYYLSGLKGDKASGQQYSSEFYNKWREITARWNDLLELEKIFLQEQTRLRSQYAGIVFRMANLSLQIEKNNKERERLLNRSLWRGTGNTLGATKTSYDTFPGYIRLLELASALDPGNIEYIDLLSREYFREKDAKKGILIEKEWLKYAPEEDPRYPEHYMRLISYYRKEKNITLTRKYLEELKNHLEKFPDRKEKVFFHDQELKETYLHPYEEFMLFYFSFLIDNYSGKDEELKNNDVEKFLTELEIKVLEQTGQQNNFLQKEKGFSALFRIYTILSKFYKENDDREKEKEVLRKILQLDRELDSIEKTLHIEKNRLEKEALEMKQQLYYEDDMEKTRRLYYLQQTEIPNKKQEIQALQSLRRSKPVENFLERLYYLEYLDGNYNDALMIVQRILEHKFATQDYKARANENKKRIKRFLENGFRETIIISDAVKN